MGSRPGVKYYRREIWVGRIFAFFVVAGFFVAAGCLLIPLVNNKLTQGLPLSEEFVVPALVTAALAGIAGMFKLLLAKSLSRVETTFIYPIGSVISALILPPYYIPHQLIHTLKSLLQKGETRIDRKLISAFVNQYVVGECESLEPTNGNPANIGNGGNGVSPKIITSFVTYGELVRSVLDKAIEISGNEDVVCFTTLTMPIPQWFNFEPLHITPDDAQQESVVSQANSFPFLRVSPRWMTHYTSHMAKLVSQEKPVMTQRCILTVKDCSEEHVPTDCPLHQESWMKNLAKSWVLVPSRDGHAFPEEVEPLDRDVISGIWHSSGLPEPMRRVYENLYREALTEGASAYLIVPPFEGDSAALSNHVIHSKWKWDRLSESFAQRFHTSRDYCFVKSFSKNEVHHWFESKAKHMPYDFFLVGFRPQNGAPEQVNWRFCLAADFDSDINRITLEMVTNKSNFARMVAIKSFVEAIQRSNSPFTCWCN